MRKVVSRAIMNPTELESDLHLYQPPLYRSTGEDAEWSACFADAVRAGGRPLSWDPSAVLAVLSFSYTTGDRTLVREIRRRPWLARIEPDRSVSMAPVPEHGRLDRSPARIAQNLHDLLRREAFTVCEGRKEIYVLLSGGLDSRVVAAVVAELCREGRLNCVPVGVTWGVEACRDVVYGGEAARRLGFEWIHVGLGPEDLRRNLRIAADGAASLVAPIHLHSMHWFQNVPSDALVLAGSYGDMIGRAEFSKKHLLEYDEWTPFNAFGLLRDDAAREGAVGIAEDVNRLRDRTPGAPDYAHCEHFLHAHYTRNLLGQAMSTIRQYCGVYQMFTHPDTYTAMWSIHPARRNDEVYAALLARLDPELARLPWARTNRALRGATLGARRGLRARFHEYAAWIEGPLWKEMYDFVDPEWFAQTGLFDPRAVEQLGEEVRTARKGTGPHGLKPYEKWSWLASFRRLSERISEWNGDGPTEFAPDNVVERTVCPRPPVKRGWVRRAAETVYCKSIDLGMRRLLKKARRGIRSRRALRRYPPIPWSSTSTAK